MNKHIDVKQFLTGLAVVVVGVVLYKIFVRKTTKDGVETLTFKLPNFHK